MALSCVNSPGLPSRHRALNRDTVSAGCRCSDASQAATGAAEAAVIGTHPRSTAAVIAIFSSFFDFGFFLFFFFFLKFLSQARHAMPGQAWHLLIDQGISHRGLQIHRSPILGLVPLPQRRRINSTPSAPPLVVQEPRVLLAVGRRRSVRRHGLVVLYSEWRL